MISDDGFLTEIIRFKLGFSCCGDMSERVVVVVVVINMILYAADENNVQIMFPANTSRTRGENFSRTFKF